MESANIAIRIDDSVGPAAVNDRESIDEGVSVVQTLREVPRALAILDFARTLLDSKSRALAAAADILGTDHANIDPMAQEIERIVGEVLKFGQSVIY